MATLRVPPPLIRSLSTLHRWMVQATGGRALTRFRGEPMILLTTTGAKTGKARTWPLTGLRAGDGWMVAGSNGGHDHHPAWYLNLVADPRAMVTEGRRTVPVTAQVAQGDERAEAYRRFVDYLGVYADYEKATTREIPVVFLDPVTG